MASTLSIAANIAQLTSMPICLAAYVPQWVTMVRNRSSDDVSLNAYLIWIFSASLGLFYSIVQLAETGSGSALLITTVVNFICLVITAVMIAWYRRDTTHIAVVNELEESITSLARAEAIVTEIQEPIQRIIPLENEMREESRPT